MQPNSQPTPQDVASVAAHLGEQPAPAPAEQPAPQMQPAPVTPQAAPTQEPSDPFATLFASEPAPAEPATPATPPTPTAPTEPAQPTQPTEPVTQPTEQPAPQAPAQEEETYETYDEYMARVNSNIPEAPALPDAEKVDATDPAAIKGFFDDLVNTAVAQAEAKITRRDALQRSEKQLWDSAMDKYGSLRTNKPLRDMVHSIRVGYMQRGTAITPTQAAERLLESLGNERREGAAGAAVVTSYEAVQPNGGGGGANLPTTADTANVLEQVQTGGEAALADILDREIKAGRL